MALVKNNTSKSRKFKGTKKSITSKEDAFISNVVSEVQAETPNSKATSEINKNDVFPENIILEGAQEKDEVEKKIESVLTSYKQEEVNSSSLTKYILLGVLFIIVIGSIGYYLSIRQKEETKLEPVSTDRIINWSDFEADVEQKRIEADIEFEQLKDPVEDQESTTDDTSTNNNNSSSINLSEEKENLSTLDIVLNKVDTIELQNPVDFTLIPTISEPEE